MPNLLIVDTCGVASGVAVATWDRVSEHAGPQVLAERTLPGRETQERMMTAVAQVLDESGLQPGNIDVLAVVTGPGSFTGVRIGLAAIKGLAEALNKPVVAISRLAVLAAQAASNGPVQAWIDAGRGDVFAGRYCRGACEGEAMLHGADALASVGPDDTVVMMEDSLPWAHRVVRVPPVGVREALPLAAGLARAARFADIALLDANYLRVPDAELARQARLLAGAR